MNGAEIIIDTLQRHDVDIIFGYPGGAIMPFYDALTHVEEMRHVLCRHEQGCALAADGFARTTGRLGVCVATSGPGATNLITGVANAYLDSVPLLVITGQVPSAMLGTDAFQEVDVLGMSLGIVKHSYLVTHSRELSNIITEAIQTALEGRPGPVWVDITKDALLDDVPHLPPPTRRQRREKEALSPDVHRGLEQARQLLANAQRPLLYSGGGVAAASAIEELRTFADTAGMPNVVTLHGIGNMGAGNKHQLGMLGMHGSVAANEAVDAADLILCVGARFDDRATGDIAGFAATAKIIHIDIDAAEINKRRFADVPLRGDMAQILEQLKQTLSIQPWQAHCQWLARHKGHQPCASADPNQVPNGPDFLHRLSAKAPPDSIISCDVGQHQMWVAQHFCFDHPRNHLSSGGLGTMGFGLPAAVGAQLGKPRSLVINISGDGSFMMNIQELATIKRYQLPIKIVIVDNQALGMVRQQQQLFYAGRYSEIDLLDNPDFCGLAAAFDIPAQQIRCEAQLDAGIDALLSQSGPFLLHLCTSAKQNVWPIVKPGATNKHMIIGEQTR